ncbi:LamG domain-containing protein, partial [Candidatus Poribacteria bacterium]|nr:LamG domain-containing protein [Candidatus Poribacteria bacterium]
AALCVAGPIRAAIDPDSIAGLWLFDDKSAKDESGNKHDGKLQKNPIWADGRFGGALDFKGGAYVELLDSAASLPFGAAEPFSITAWVNVRAGGTVIGKFNGGVIGAYILTVSGSGNVTFHREVAPWGLSAVGVLEAGKFNHVAATYDGKEMKVYMHGKEIGTQPRGAQNTDLATPVFIGARMTGGAPSEFFDGLIDEVALFNIALSPAQIQDVIKGLSKTKAVQPSGKLPDVWARLRTRHGD